MSFLIKQNRLPSLTRLRFIAGVLFEYGAGTFVDRLDIKYLVPIRCRVHCFFRHNKKKGTCQKHRRKQKGLSPDDWCTILETLGPTYIKLGQILSLRADVIGEEMAEAFSQLQSSVPPFAYTHVREIIKSEFDRYPEELFDSFERTPIAAASLAQVHKAKTKEGQVVAVKVQRPDIKIMIDQDVQILSFFASLLEKHVPDSRPLHPTDIVKEFAQWTRRELNFRTEGHSADRFAAMFKGDQYIHIPSVYWDQTSQKVLTMEFIDGLHADDVQGMKRRHIDPEQVALHGIRALLRQFFVEGFFHADPHPGNFFVLKDDVLCLHDFGMVGQLSVKQREELLSCFIAFVDQDIEGYQKHFLHLAILDEQSDAQGYKKDITFLLNEFFYSPKQPSIAWAFFRLINAGSKRAIRFPTDLVLFAKALVTTEAMGLKLYPQFKFNEHFKPFVEEAFREYFNPKRAVKSLKSDLLDYADILRTFPEKLQEAVEKINVDEIRVKVNATELYDLKAEFDRQNDVRLLGLALAAVLIVSSIFLYLEGVREVFGLRLGTVGLILSAFLFLLFLRKVRQGPKVGMRLANNNKK